MAGRAMGGRLQPATLIPTRAVPKTDSYRQLLVGGATAGFRMGGSILVEPIGKGQRSLITPFCQVAVKLEGGQRGSCLSKISFRNLSIVVTFVK